MRQIVEPLDELARHSASLVACPPGRLSIDSYGCVLSRYLYVGQANGAEPIRIGSFGGIHGDEPAGPFSSVRLVRMLEADPEIARGYCLFLRRQLRMSTALRRRLRSPR